jgi:putative FmdB family regulatory protein
MPLYEYECRQCGATTDVRHGFDETVTTRCPACGGELGRRFSPAGIVFKGSGFYVTDSRKPNASSGSGDGKSSGGSKESKADAGGSGAKADAGGSGPKAESGTTAA